MPPKRVSFGGTVAEYELDINRDALNLTKINF